MSGNVPNVGTIARIRVPVREVRHARARRTCRPARDHLKMIQRRKPGSAHRAHEFSRLKPAFVVREPGPISRSACGSGVLVFFAVFLGVHMFWTYGLRGASLVLPALELLSGIGLVLMITLRDPLRDTMMFVDFIQGVALGCIVLAVASTLDYQRLIWTA